MIVIINGVVIDSHLADAKDPIVQNFTLCIPSASLAIDIIKFEKAVKRAFITVPAKISLVEDVFLLIDANLNTINDATIAPKKDQNATPDTLNKEKALTPSIIEKVAPNDAPDDIPNIYGSANGF